MSTTRTAEQPPPTSTPADRTGRAPVFVTTHWSVVLSAGRSDTTRARAALARLCQTYWYPLYAHVRRRGHSAHDAQDLTQEFFAHLLGRQSLAAADPGRGRFRSFLLTALNHFLINEWAKARTQKRGGGTPLLSLDLAAAAERFDLEPTDHATPDKAFEKQWALTLLSGVLNQLEAEYRRAGQGELFAALQPTLAGRSESQPYAELAARMNLSVGAVKVAVHRLRKRYRNLIRAEIAHTLEASADIEEEMRHLFQALADR
jgi:RNA polymerase sigma-70 factor (ECF subfamily)